MRKLGIYSMIDFFQKGGLSMSPILLAHIATLLGLLGTIMGLIEAFTAVSNANSAEKADLLSARISAATNTTFFALIAAIPLLFLQAKLTPTTGQIVDSLEMAS